MTKDELRAKLNSIIHDTEFAARNRASCHERGSSPISSQEHSTLNLCRAYDESAKKTAEEIIAAWRPE